MDGIWNVARGQESMRQAQLVRHRRVTFNLDPTGIINECDASGFGSRNPGALDGNDRTERGIDGGPHFILSPETTAGTPTMGFEWCLSTRGLSNYSATPEVDGFTVTIYALIGVTYSTDAIFTPEWAAFEPLTGVQLGELYCSFDTNATALRFRIENFASPDPPPQSTSISVCLCEL